MGSLSGPFLSVVVIPLEPPQDPDDLADDLETLLAPAHIVPLLPVLIELIVESAPFSIELTGLDEFTMECGADSRVLLEGSLPVEERRAHPVECRVVEAINGEEVGSGAEFSTRRGQALFSLGPPVPNDIGPGF
jgi:hypothetical protein